jgi:hypothetical protein
MRATASLLLSLVGSVAWAGERPAGLDAVVEAFEANTGLNLHLVGDAGEDPNLVTADRGPVELDKALIALPMIESLILGYPSSIRGEKMTDLYLYGKLRMRGTPFLGAAVPGKKRFDLAIRDRTTAEGLAATLHHEIAHLIEFSEDFPAEVWVSASAPYNGNLQDDVETKDVELATWWQQGFISRYASKNRHEDFAELAEVAFTDPARARRAASENPAISTKLELLTRAYRHYTPGMPLPWIPGDNARDVSGASYAAGDGGTDAAAPADTAAAADTAAPPDPASAEAPVAPDVQKPTNDAGQRRTGQRRLDDNGNPLPRRTP